MAFKGISNLPMGPLSWKQIFVILCILFFNHVSMAQDPVPPGTQSTVVSGSPGRSLDPGTNQLGVWAGYSPNNPTYNGSTTNRPFFELNVQYARVLFAIDTFAIKYIADFVPVAIIKQPHQGYDENGELVDLPGSDQTIPGVGVSPIGLQINLCRGCVLQPYVNGTGGILYFTRDVPVAMSSKFNFTFALGGGVEIWHKENQSFILGYKYQHISNGYTADQNPGVDMNLFYVGYAWSWKK
jgi:hypothetical protein